MGRMNYVPGKDATVVARLRAAGAILLGKTNTPEFTLAGAGIAGLGTTANIIYGVSRNPYDLTRSTAGSSGGAGAIVAAGGAAFDIGSDWGGSIRGPSHNNGIAEAIKPTVAVCRVPLHRAYRSTFGVSSDSCSSLGPMARRVERSARLYYDAADCRSGLQMTRRSRPDPAGIVRRKVRSPRRPRAALR